MKFEKIKQEALRYPNYFDVREDRDYDYNRVEYIELLFTVYGDYCGSTVERSNHDVLKQELQDNYSLFNIEIKSYGYSTYAIVIIGDLNKKTFNFIFNDCLESLENYPLLDDMHYSDQCANDCIEAWYEWQYSDVVRDLRKDYDIDLDDIDDLNDPDKLLNFIDEHDLFDRIEDTEINSRSYWYIRDRDIEEITKLINEIYCYV